MNELGGIFPTTFSSLLSLPGIGQYTAGAISSIVFNEVKPAVDGNVIRVISRMRAIKHTTLSSGMNKLANRIGQQLVDESNPGTFNQGMMELGATICTPQSPSCDQCPVRGMCYGRRLSEYRYQVTSSSSSSSSQTLSSFFTSNIPPKTDSIIKNDCNSSITQYSSQSSIDSQPSDISSEVILEGSQLNPLTQEDVDLSQLSPLTQEDVDSLPSQVTIFPMKKKKKFITPLDFIYCLIIYLIFYPIIFSCI